MAEPSEQPRLSSDGHHRRLNPKKPPLEDLTPSQKRVYHEMVELINREPVEIVDQLYNSIPDAHGGKVIGTDAARELSPHYRNSREGVILYAPVTAAPASAYAQDRFRRDIIKIPRCSIHTNGDGSPSRPRLLLTAGGPASGKTACLGNLMLDSHDLVMDQNLGKYDRSVEQIELALQNNWEVHIFYVYRPFPVAAARVIDRAHECGRWSPLGKIAEAHKSAQESVVRLVERYAGNDARVQISLVANFWSPTNETPPEVITVADIREGGKYHLDDITAMQREVQEAIERAREEARIEPRLLDALANGKNPYTNMDTVPVSGKIVC